MEKYMTENTITLDRTVKEAIMALYEKEPDKSPEQVMLSMFTHGIFQFLIKEGGKHPDEHVSATDLLLNCQEMIYHIIKHLSEGVEDEKDSQEN